MKVLTTNIETTYLHSPSYLVTIQSQLNMFQHTHTIDAVCQVFTLISPLSTRDLVFLPTCQYVYSLMTCLHSPITLTITPQPPESY